MNQIPSPVRVERMADSRPRKDGQPIPAALDVKIGRTVDGTVAVRYDGDLPVTGRWPIRYTLPDTGEEVVMRAKVTKPWKRSSPYTLLVTRPMVEYNRLQRAANAASYQTAGAHRPVVNVLSLSGVFPYLE